MYTYKDMTFCQFWKDCKKGSRCFRALRDEELKRVQFDYVIAYFSKKPDCFKEKENVRKN